MLVVVGVLRSPPLNLFLDHGISICTATYPYSDHGINLYMSAYKTPTCYDSTVVDPSRVLVDSHGLVLIKYFS